MEKIKDNSSNEFYNIPKNERTDKKYRLPVCEDIDDFIFEDEKTVPSER